MGTSPECMPTFAILFEHFSYIHHSTELITLKFRKLTLKNVDRSNWNLTCFRLWKQLNSGGRCFHGVPLWPTFADFNRSHVEKLILNQNRASTPHIYMRCVDDIFCGFNSNRHINFFKQRLQIHCVQKFTTEKNEERFLQFPRCVIPAARHWQNTNFCLCQVYWHRSVHKRSAPHSNVI